jgi:hypothetical protein
MAQLTPYFRANGGIAEAVEGTAPRHTVTTANARSPRCRLIVSPVGEESTSVGNEVADDGDAKPEENVRAASEAIQTTHPMQ